MKTIVYRACGVTVEYTPHPDMFDQEYERLSRDMTIDDLWVKESE